MKSASAQFGAGVAAHVVVCQTVTALDGLQALTVRVLAASWPVLGCHFVETVEIFSFLTDRFLDFDRGKNMLRSPWLVMTNIK